MDQRSAWKLEKLKASGGLYCFNWAANQIKLHGSWKTHSSYTSIDIAPVPCHYSYTAHDGKKVKTRDDCVYDYDKTVAYFGDFLQMTTFYNKGIF